MKHHKGYAPRSLVSLVASSSLIVKGRFGAYLGNNLFYGYVEGKDETLEEFMARHKIEDVTDAYNWGVPMSQYEIIVDEVYLGSEKDQKLIFRRYEAASTDRVLTNPELERIFFFVRNPDMKTYGVRGEASILNNENGVYNYYEFLINDIDVDLSGYVKRPLDFTSSMQAKEVESAIKNEINRQKNAKYPHRHSPTKLKLPTY